MKNKWLKKTIPVVSLGLLMYFGTGDLIYAKQQPMQTTSKETYEQVSNKQHKKDLEFITNYMTELRDNNPSMYGKTPIPGLAIVDREIWDEIKAEGLDKKPFNHFLIHYNIPANALFITKYDADEKREHYISEKHYMDYDADGLKRGTEDHIRWLFHSLEIDLLGSTGFSFLGKDKYEARIGFDEFVFSESDEDYQKVLEKNVSEYKKVIHEIAKRLKNIEIPNER